MRGKWRFGLGDLGPLRRNSLVETAWRSREGGRAERKGRNKVNEMDEMAPSKLLPLLASCKASFGLELGRKLVVNVCTITIPISRSKSRSKSLSALKLSTYLLAKDGNLYLHICMCTLPYN
jgi:hypothetical protein